MARCASPAMPDGTSLRGAQAPTPNRQRATWFHGGDPHGPFTPDAFIEEEVEEEEEKEKEKEEEEEKEDEEEKEEEEEEEEGSPKHFGEPHPPKTPWGMCKRA
eukprot:8315948-Pyramimonas_sp.AAC.1